MAYTGVCVAVEDAVPSAPLAVRRRHHAGPIYERLRRDNVGSRRCAPCDNSWIAVDRIVHDGRTCFLFHRNHDCGGGDALEHDLVDRDLSAVGFTTRRRFQGADGQVDVITDDCPGVRLRALVEALKSAETTLPRAVAWHIVARTAALREVWGHVGVEPIDTFVGFDGSVHLFPSLPACWDAEMPSFDGNEIFDPLVVDDSHEKLGQLLCATLPRNGFLFDESTMRLMREYPRIADERVRRYVERLLPQWRPHDDPAVPRAIEAFLAGPPPTGDATSDLAPLVREYFPRTYARHRRVQASVGGDVDHDGVAREAKILARVVEPRRLSDPGQGSTSWLVRLWSRLRSR